MQRETYISPRDLAAAVGASESSLRRWVDAGDIRVLRSPGGHRRIPIASAITWIRKTGTPVLRPDLLGLSDVPSSVTTQAGTALTKTFTRLLIDGEAARARALLVGSFLGGQSIAQLADGPIREALSEIGELWHTNPAGILTEHRATAICVDIVAVLRSLLPEPEAGSPLAIGGSPSGDPYLLGAMLASATLVEAGFRAVNFGASTPPDLLADEAITRKARLVWLSIGLATVPPTLKLSIHSMAQRLTGAKIDLVIGGRQAQKLELPTSKHVVRASTLSELSAWARGSGRG